MTDTRRIERRISPTKTLTEGTKVASVGIGPDVCTPIGFEACIESGLVDAFGTVGRTFSVDRSGVVPDLGISVETGVELASRSRLGLGFEFGLGS